MTQLMPSLPELLTAWLPQQRWFPAKGRDITLDRVGGVRLSDPSGLAELEVHLIAVASGQRTDIISVPVSAMAWLRGVPKRINVEAMESDR